MTQAEYSITLTEIQLRDLKAFLDRCDLRGVEAARFMSLAQAVGAAAPQIKKEVDDKVN
jgi:hypothetical protein